MRWKLGGQFPGQEFVDAVSLICNVLLRVGNDVPRKTERLDSPSHSQRKQSNVQHVATVAIRCSTSELHCKRLFLAVWTRSGFCAG
jgi:hypothetical protein